MDIEVEEKAYKMARICKVLGNEKATAILILLKKPMNVTSLASEIGLSLSRTSRLVDNLEKIGLVKTEYKVFIGKHGVNKFVSRTVKKIGIYF